METVTFHKSSELYLDAHPTLRWETKYTGTNNSRLTLRTENQAPETVVVSFEALVATGQGD